MRPVSLPSARSPANPGRATWLVLAAGLGVGSLVEAIAEHRGAQGIGVAIAVGAATGLAWWRPVAALGLLFVATVVQAPLDDPLYDISVALYAIPASVLALAARCGGRRLAAGLLLGLGVFVVVLVAAPEHVAQTDILFVAGMFLGIPALVGHTFRSRSALNTELRERTARLAEDRETRAEEAAAAERRRIAGELHDLVAHGVSGMVVQAGAARRLVAQGDARAPEAILAIEEGGREALDELRRLLGVLRHDDADLALAPQPSLARVGALVAQMRETGLDVQLRVEGEHAPMSPGVDVAGYRIVEEALRSAQRHGGDGPATVVVHYGSQHVDLAILGATPEAADLVGLRERVRLFGGELEAARRGSAPALRAHLPLFGAGT